MERCSFCGGWPVETRAENLRLCADCRRALCAVAPGDRRYRWFAAAVREKLFAGGRAAAPYTAPRGH